jgi:N-methylhydantoinase A/oxoprolinase/acetone carboxylase beta subunit
MRNLASSVRRADAQVATREVYFAGAFRSTPIFMRDRLATDHVIQGPAVIEESGSTTIVPPGWTAKVIGLGELMLERA